MENHYDGEEAANSVPSRASPSDVYETFHFGPMAGQVGLLNLGNTCFMNAGLQCLSHIEPFVAHFLSGRFEEDVNTTSTLGCKGELARSFADLQRQLWLGDKSSQNPRSLHATLARFAPHLFEGYRQQDVQEFLAFCLDGLHEDLNRALCQPSTQNEEKEKAFEQRTQGQNEEIVAAFSWMRYLERDKSFLVDLMQGQIRSAVVCSRCGYTSRVFDPFLYLSLPVTGQMTKITDAIEKYLEEEVLAGDEQWFCEKCKEKVDATKKIDLWKLPPILVLHLKRFEYDAKRRRFRKTDTMLGAPALLDLTAYCSSPQRDGATFEIVAIANHSGSYGSGHYTATCRVGEVWHHFNDDRVSKLKSAYDPVSQAAYVLFLARRCDNVPSTPLSTKSSAPLKRQSLSAPEFWPHLASSKNSVVGKLLNRSLSSESMELDLPSHAASAPVIFSRDSAQEVSDGQCKEGARAAAGTENGDFASATSAAKVPSSRDAPVQPVLSLAVEGPPVATSRCRRCLHRLLGRLNYASFPPS